MKCGALQLKDKMKLILSQCKKVVDAVKDSLQLNISYFLHIKHHSTSKCASQQERYSVYDKQVLKMIKENTITA